MFEPEAPALPDLSPDQAAAWQVLTDRLAAHGVELESGRVTPAGEWDDAEVLAVTGKAGSGKTVLLAGLAHRLKDAGLAAVTAEWEPRKRKRRSFAVLAPTNKAASVLRRRGVEATTIHRIVYTPVYDPQYERVAEWLTGERTARPEVEGLGAEALDRAAASYRQHESVPGALAAAGVRGADFITGWTRREDPLDIALVDESSMLDDKQLEDLRRIFRLVVLFGDPAQLAPVGSDGQMVFESLPEARRLALERIHRQAADSPILDLAHALADPGLDFDRFDDLVRRTAERDERIAVVPRADAALMVDSPVLVWTNRTRVRLIRGFRAAHGLPEDALVPGEPLICDGLEIPLRQRRQRIDLERRGLVKGAQARYLGPGRKPGFARLHVHGSEEPGISVASIIQIESPEGDEPMLLSAARSGAVFVHGAASTIHKAQGSQWPVVQVFAPDLAIAARTGRDEAGILLWKRLAYVALTRAEERLVWVTRSMISRPEKPLGATEHAG